MDAFADEELEQIEVDLLTTAIYRRYGYDFRDYARPTLVRRLRKAVEDTGADTLAELQHRLLRDEATFREVLGRLAIHTTEMFRDPAFFVALREHVFPVLATYPTCRIWHAGCSSGEEVYALAILLSEAGLHDRSTIYATDLDPRVIERARSGVYAADLVPAFTRSYRAAGGNESFSRYYRARHGHVAMDRSLARNVVFDVHNLATDDSFGEMHLILCRNVLIYFNSALRERVVDLLRRSLIRRGFLGLGTHESIALTRAGADFDELDHESRIYRLR